MAETDLTPLSDDEQQQLQEAFFGPQAEAAALSGGITLGGSKDAFCESWPTIKDALEFIAKLPLIPQKLKDAIPKVIKWGDSIFGSICKT
jgi:hypothetical protein